MFRRLAHCVVGGLFVIGLVGCYAKGEAPGQRREQPGEARDIGGRLFAQADAAAPAAAKEAPLSPAVGQPIVMPQSRVTFTLNSKVDVPSQRDAVVSYYATEVSDDEKDNYPPHKLRTLKVGERQMNDQTIAIMKTFRYLEEGDYVKKDHLLAQLDDRLPCAEVLSKKAKVAMAQADHTAGIELKNEALARYDRERNLFQRSPGSTSQQDVGLARATWEKQKAEEISKAQAIKVANVEQLQAETVLEFYQLRTPISGRIKTIYKRPNEAVKAFEPVLQVYTDDRVRVEGLLDQRFLDALRDAMKGKGVRVVIEVAPDRAPIATLSGHLQEVTSVAVSRDAKQIVSGSDDGSVLVWDPKGGRLPRSLQGLSPVAVKAVACTPASTAANLCIAGMRDGRGRIWDLDNDKAKPIELDSRHTGAIRCATFSPDGKFCVTGGEDREIRLWDAATGKMRERFPGGHGGFVTSVQFTPNSKLVSAGEDNALRFWTVGEKGAKWDKTIPGRRGGVNQLGVSSDGKRVLFDQARMIRILSLPDGNTEGELQSVADFSAFALFSPDGRLILTAGGSESGLQLWRAPHAGSRGYEIRQLVVEQESPTCAAFAPNGAFIVTGSRERHVLVWPVPAEQEVRQEIVAEAPRFDDLYEGTKRQRKIWAELANPGGRLTPGDTVTMVIYPLQ